MEAKKTYEELEQRIEDLEKEIREHRRAEKALPDITGRRQIEEDLRESEERYRLLVESMYDGLGIQDENRVLIYANRRLCEMLDYSERELLGHPVTDFLDEANQEILARELEKRRRGKMNSYELTWNGPTEPDSVDKIDGSTWIWDYGADDAEEGDYQVSLSVSDIGDEYSVNTVSDETIFTLGGPGEADGGDGEGDDKEGEGGLTSPSVLMFILLIIILCALAVAMAVRKRSG